MAGRKSSQSKALVQAYNQSVAEAWRQGSEDVVKEQRDVLQPSTQLWISTRNGKFSYAGHDYGKTLDVVVFADLATNVYYIKDFDPGKPSGAACYAFGKEDELGPPPDLEGKQSDKCSTCGWNVFGTAKRGDGKACSNYIRLAVMPVPSADAILPANLADWPLLMVNVPPSSQNTWRMHRKSIIEDGRPLYSEVTQLQLQDHRKGTGFEMVFQSLGLVGHGIDELHRRYADAVKLLETPPPLDQDGGKTQSKWKKRSVKKRAVKKKPARRKKAAARR